MPVHYIAVGDTLTPLGAVLKQEDDDGELQPTDLSGKTVKVIIVNTAGTTVVAETTTGVTVTDATAGEVEYDFQTGASALSAGVYFVYFRVYGTGGASTERDTFPAPKEGNKMKVIVSAL